MKTENLIILGVGGYLAYKMIQKDIDTAVQGVVGGIGGAIPQIPNITFPNITLPNITLPNITLPQTIVVAGTQAASPSTPANIQPSALAPGAPDPYTGAQPDVFTGMPKGAQWANIWGPGYAYDWKNTVDMKLSTAPKAPTAISLMPGGGSFKFTNAITQPPVFGAGTAQNAPTAQAVAQSMGPSAYQQQQAAYAAAAKGTPALVPIYTAAYIATLPKTGVIGGGTAFQSGNGGYNTGIKYF